MSGWLSKIEGYNKQAREYNDLEAGCVGAETASERMARVIRELAGYVTFLEGYCSKRMSAEKARKRFILPNDAKELLR